MRIILLLYSIFFSTQLLAQGFNHKYQYNGKLSVFTNILLDKDTLIMTGLVTDSLPPHQQAILFMKLDTNGNEISTRIYVDSLGANYSWHEKGVPMLKTQDQSGFLLGSQIDERLNSCVLRLNNAGDVLWTKEYADPTTTVDLLKAMIEVEDGYLLAGEKQLYQGLHVQFYVMKIDKLGNMIWEKKYGDLQRFDLLNSLIAIDNNTFAFGGTSFLRPNGGMNTTWDTRSDIYVIDSLGNIKQSWQSFIDPANRNDNDQVAGLRKLPNGNWIYMGTTIKLFNIAEYMIQPKIVLRDSAFNLIWEKKIGPMNSRENYFNEFRPSPGGGYIAVGQMRASIDNAQEGWMYRFDEEGNGIWSLRDTAEWSSNYEAWNYWIKSVTLSSGSIVAAGVTLDFDAGSDGSHGWLVKVSPDGCIDTIFCKSVSGISSVKPEVHRLKVFPNPATDFLSLVFDQPFSGRVQVTDVTGKVVFEENTLKNIEQYQISVRKWAAGVYFLTTESRSGERKVLRFLVGQI